MSDLDSARSRIRPYVERAQHFTGWNLDRAAPKSLEEGPPWSYQSRAAQLARAANSILDMGTGGGEVFERVSMPHPGRAVATESWSVNVPVAAARLQPRGISVVRTNSLVLPFRDRTFDLVLSRHEELHPTETARVLSFGGHVLTQQVGRNRWCELREFFPRMQDFGDLFGAYEAGFREAGLTIAQSRKHDWKVAYRGLGDVVFLLCIAPWDLPDFDPLGRDLRALMAAGDALSTHDGIELTESSFLLEATKDRTPEV